MRPTLHTPAWMLLLPLLAAALAGCAAAPTAAPAPSPAPGPEVPAEVLAAQEAVLDFLHEGAATISPRQDAPWQVSEGGPDLPAGFAYYFFTSGSAVMTVSYPEPAGTGTIYHVSIGDTITSLCWQANVDSGGQIVETGTPSELSLGEQNPAALYCQDQGYRYEIREQQAGGQCGVCVFEDNSICNGWAYLRGQCQPGDRPADP